MQWEFTNIRYKYKSLATHKYLFESDKAYDISNEYL